MSQGRTAASPDRASPSATGLAEPVMLSKLVYRSRATRRLSSLDLYKIAVAAQSRNRTESITGLVLYDEDSFFQWLEGPADGLDRVMTSIRNDPRHTDIEVLDRAPADARVFGDWSMKLASTGEAEAMWRQDVMAPPSGMIRDLRRNPKNAPILLAALVPVPVLPTPADDVVTEFRAPQGVPFNQHAAALLKAVIVGTVIPELAIQHGVAPMAAPQPPAKRVWELAEMLVSADQGGAVQLIREVQAATARPLLHFATLLEPAARRLGDLWNEDVCTEFDVTLGLSRIQTAVRLLGSLTAPMVPAAAGLDVLIAPEPGEVHGLGALLDAEVMGKIGWKAQREHPKDDRALQDLLAGTWYDVLDLSLSAAFRRDHWLPRLEKTIAAARDASRNPALVVVVGGRVFAENGADGGQVGADAVSTTALGVDRMIMNHINRTS